MQVYSGKAFTDNESQVIVAQAVTDEANRIQQLERTLKNCVERNGERPN
jgi:hypothetical protein